jgi:hypothetical protein
MASGSNTSGRRRASLYAGAVAILLACFQVTCLLAQAPVYNVIRTDVHSFDLPNAYLPKTLPAKPLDSDLRVGLVLPIFDPASSAAWPSRAGFGDNKLDTINVIWNFAQPAAEVLPEILRRTFPKLSVSQSIPKPGEFDLVVVADLVSRHRTKTNGTLLGPEVEGTLTLSDIAGREICRVKGVGRSEVTKELYWSAGTRVKATGVPALQQMFEDLVRGLVRDPGLESFLAERQLDRSLPSDLATTVAFDDSSGIFPNGRLDAGEKARLSFKIRNGGKGRAFGPRLKIVGAPETVAIENEIAVEDVPGGGEAAVEVEIEGGLELPTSLLPLTIETHEARGYGGRSVVLEIATRALEKPSIEIVDVVLSDRGGATIGDGDGQVSNGERLEVTLRVRNEGPGACAGAALAISSAISGLELPPGQIPIPAIPARAVREARFFLGLPASLDADTVKVDFRVVESRGSAVATAHKSESFKVKLRKPAIELAWRMLDGNSAGSRGDRDGIANNGESLELVLKPINRGEIAARQVRLRLEDREGRKILPDPVQLDFGDLPPRTEAAEQRISLQIPRSLRTDSAKLSFAASINQADFLPREESISIPFSARFPSLSATLHSESSAVAGLSVGLFVVIQNQGSLTAEDLRAEVISENSAVELIGPDRQPARAIQLEVGSLQARAQSSRLQFIARLRRNLEGPNVRMKIRLLQRDFPVLESWADLEVGQEAPLVISAAPEPPTTTFNLAAAPAVPASISFLRLEDGDQVADERISLRFEVQSQAPLETVRLTHNERLVPLEPSSRPHGQGSPLWRFDQEVRLEPGTNRFEVIVITSAGARSSRALSLVRQQRSGRIWLAAVGISKYADPRIRDLGFAREDARAFYDYYRNRFGLAEERTFLLLDEAASLKSIKGLLGTELAAKANHPDDTVILYFAGHGKREPDSGSLDLDGFSKYLLPSDANTADLFGTALSMEEVTRILQRLRSERVVLIIDSCFSGAAGGGRSPYDPTEESWRSPVDDEFLTRLATTGRGRVILTASGMNEVAIERMDLGHGVFTYYFLEGLEGRADLDRDGNIDADEIYRYVSQKVVALTDGKQNPVKKSPSQVGSILLGRSQYLPEAEQ